MKYTLDCLKCDAEIEVSFDVLIKGVACANCGAKYELNYDDGYTEAGDEFSYFWLESLTSFGRSE